MKRKDIKISIIVPVYRVEPYIAKCITSIQMQDYYPLEVIVVNDHTDDHSMDICHAVVGNDNRFRIIDLDRNVGVGMARNIGMSYATGDYIYFIDSDDYLDRTAISQLVANIDENTDVVEAGCIVVKDGIIINEWEKQEVFDDINMFSCHLYSARFLQQHLISFPKWNIAEDQVFLLEVRIHNPRIVHTKIKSFFYCRYDKRFNTERYTTVSAEQHVRAEIEMLGLLISHRRPSLNEAVKASIGKMCLSVRKRLPFMDLIELEELLHAVIELVDLFCYISSGCSCERENVILEDVNNIRDVITNMIHKFLTE